MSLKFGQFRKENMGGKAGQDLNYSLDNKFITKNAFSAKTPFRDVALKLNSPIVNGKYYYLKFTVAKNNSREVSFSVALKKSNDIYDDTQTLERYTVARGLGTEFNTYELCITPLTDFDTIAFIIDREPEDLLEDHGDYYGATLSINIIACMELYNMREKLNIGNAPIRAFGIESHPNFSMCVNGEEIRVGPSGIYELNESDYQVDFIGFMSVADEDYFILNYQY